MALKKLISLFLLIFSLPTFARDYIIYQIGQDFPMGYESENLKRNYYVNMGSAQGVKEGTRLDVFRIVSTLNPYESNKRINLKVKIGEVTVLHSDDSSAITEFNPVKEAKNIYFDIPKFMIGDLVGIHVKD